jgi:formamidopyrimidine-DNA glycosylase
MPELPEVETTSRILARLANGKIIQDVWTDYGSLYHKGKRNIKNKDYFPTFKKLVVGHRIINVHRRGKNVLIDLEGKKTILIHMKMTGHLLYGQYKYDKKNNTWAPVEIGPLQDPYNRFVHLVFSLNNKKHIALSDTRKFAKVCVLETENIYTDPELSHLGPEPLTKNFTLNTFSNILSRGKAKKIKQVLLDQTLIAGIGNIYSDEALWLSGISPFTETSKIKGKNLALLYKSIRNVLNKGIDFGGDSMSDYRTPTGERGRFQLHHEAYRRKGEKCRKRGCSGIINRTIIGGRSTHYCDKHQKKL